MNINVIDLGGGGGGGGGGSYVTVIKYLDHEKIIMSISIECGST